MPVFEKTAGGEVLLRGIDRRVAVGERVEANGGFADYLRERGDFDEVDVQDADFREVDDAGGGAGGDGAGEGDVHEEDGPPDDLELTEHDGTLPFSPEEHTNDEIADRVADIDDRATLIALRRLEQEQKDRTGATDAIQSRLGELEE